MNILLFAGTTEGRRLAEELGRLAVDVTVCVATEYGGDVLGHLPDRFVVRVGRMDAAAMRDVMEAGRFDFVVDATHPYAVAVSENIRHAAEGLKLPRLRLLRARSVETRCLHVDTAEAAAKRLAETDGAVLLTTGSKDLPAFARVAGFAERMFPRVLPSVESIRVCEELGFLRSHIIAMQGPFSRELNLALMRQHSIRVLVTKDGGSAGGFLEKMTAAEEAGVLSVVIGRPAGEDGLSLEAVLEFIAGKTETQA